jgi:hypothetical protein
MRCLQNISRTIIPNDVIVSYTRLYKSIGNNHFNHQTLESDNTAMIRQTIAKDIQFFSKILDVNISEGRIRSLIYKGVKAKNKNEIFIQNLYSAFTKIHTDTSSFELLPTEIFDMLHFLYDNVVNPKLLQYKKIQKDKEKTSLLSQKAGSKREVLEHLIKLYDDVVEAKQYEQTFVIINFIIDFIKSDIFEDKNEEVGLILLYILLLTNDLEVFEYISFFELVYEYQEEYKKAFLESTYNWKEGYAQVLPLHRYIINISLLAYQELNHIIRDYEFDQNLNKSNNIENTISKFDDVFTKDDIRNIHPYISDSTINRTLKRLRDDDIIRPLGKGRSAKWIKLEKNPNKKLNFEQLDLKL